MYVSTEVKLDIREVAYGSAAYHDTVALRNAVLRHPLGLILTPKDLANEQAHHHLACYRTGKLVACLILVPSNDGAMRMRQVAVAHEAQRQGVGQALIIYAEEFARSRNITTIHLHARETAVPFYEKLGYQKEGEPFEEVTLPHWAMVKNL